MDVFAGLEQGRLRCHIIRSDFNPYPGRRCTSAQVGAAQGSKTFLNMQGYVWEHFIKFTVPENSHKTRKPFFPNWKHYKRVFENTFFSKKKFFFSKTSLKVLKMELTKRFF